MNGTTQSILNWSRYTIPDPKVRNKAVRGLEIGRTAIATGNRETFFIKNVPTGSVYLYVEPYEFSPTASLGTAESTDKVFLWASSTLSCIFPDGSSDSSVRPTQYKPVLAYYEYSERLPYSYSDEELADMLSPAISFLSNTYDISYSYTGTGTSTVVSITSDIQKELVAKALAIKVRRSYVDEQKKRGLGVRFRGPLQSIDSVAQMKDYETVTKGLEAELKYKAEKDKISNASEKIDVYDESSV